MKNIIRLLTVGALASSIGFVNAEEGHNHAKKPHAQHERHASHMLEGYMEVADALFKDDLAEAKEAAEEMAEHDGKSSLAKPAAVLAKSKDLASARKQFKTLSDLAIKLSKGKEGYHVAFCPMVPGGGASWLQDQGKKVNNPYMGAKMPHCGKFKK